VIALYDSVWGENERALASRRVLQSEWRHWPGSATRMLRPRYREYTNENTRRFQGRVWLEDDEWA